MLELEKQREKIIKDFDERINETCIQLKRIDDQLKELILKKEDKNNELLNNISEEIRKCKYNKLSRSNIKRKKKLLKELINEDQAF